MSENKKVNSSIVFKLNTWHVSQVFFKFIWINLVIILFFSGALFYHTETKIAGIAETIPEQTEITETRPRGIRIPGFFNRVFREHMRDTYRQVVFEQDEESFWGRVYSLKFRVLIPHGNLYYTVDYYIGDTVGLFVKFFIALLVLELFSLIDSIGKGARAMRRALAPIAVLTETARSINASQTVRPDAHIRELMGTIDTINANRLDTRLPINSAQNELKDLTAAINGMLERINESYHSQIRFVSDASHELRTPIAVIQGYANLLDRWGKNDQKALEESIDAIKSEAENMKALVEQLLFLARGDNDSMHLSMEEIDLSHLVSDIIRETVMIDSSHEFSAKTDEEVYIIGDAQLIKQAIRIFIDNSIKYTPCGESVSVSTFCDGDSSKVTVQDNGIGIPSDDLPYVFDRFYRSDDSRARKTGGTGLGLSIAKWIIDRHGGNVEILSRKDIGTRITISLIGKKLA